MADINDFKIINNKCKKIFDLQHKDIKFDNLKEDKIDIKKTRIGFYYLALESITGIKDFDKLSDMIIDTDYHNIIFHNKSIDDLGIDAVYIDDESEEIKINLFNFKFREKFNSDDNKEECSLSRSTKFLEYILAESDEEIKKLPQNIVSEYLIKVRGFIYGNKLCQLNLYMISNENKGFPSSSNQYIKMLENSYGMKIIDVNLDLIINYCTPTNFNKICKFWVSSNEMLSFSKNDLSTQTSFVLKMSLIDLIRITSKVEAINNKYDLENDMEIINCQLDYSLLFDNVRGYLGNTIYNNNIQETIMNSPDEFFMYNNGITMTSEIINSAEKKSGSKFLMTLKNFQIVNGGQTLRSIYEYLYKNKDERGITSLRKASILVRVFNISETDIRLKNRIAEYTNSQNKIENSDLKSVDDIQFQIENYLKDFNILYRRKIGDLGDEVKNYEIIISKERLAQILYAINGHPNGSGSQKKKLFGDYYDDIFRSSNFVLEKIPDICKKYEQIKAVYDSKKYKYYELKLFYIIYIVENYKKEISDAIDILENILGNKKTTNISEARLLLKREVKESIDEQFRNA